MAASPRRYEVTDEEWSRLAQYFEQAPGKKMGRPRNDDRQMLNGILWIARSGASWRDLPERYGAWSSVYRRFKEWQESGLFQRIFEELAEEADLQDMSVDSTYIKAHQASAGAKKGT
jgi:transposase